MDQEKGRESKTRKHRSRGKEIVASECNSFVIAMEVWTWFFKFPSKNPVKACLCNLIKCQHGRDGFLSENTVIRDKHFRKHEIIKGAGGVRHRFGLFRTV